MFAVKLIFIIPAECSFENFPPEYTWHEFTLLLLLDCGYLCIYRKFEDTNNIRSSVSKC